MESEKTYFFVSDGIVDYYFFKDGSLSHFVFDADYADVLRAAGAEELGLEGVMNALDEGQVFETGGYIYVKKGSSCLILDKKNLYKEAVEQLVGQIDMLQQIDNFLPMSGKLQKNRLRTFLYDILCLMPVLPDKLSVPIFSTYKYTQGGIQHDLIPKHITIGTDSATWKDVIGTIKPAVDIRSDSSLVFSIIVKQLITDLC